MGFAGQLRGIMQLPPGWISATAYNINNTGEVIGEGMDSDGKEKGYLYSNGEYIELLPPGWSDVVPEDIDDSGTVAGYGTEGDVIKGFVYNNGTYLILTSPVRPNTKIIGINNNREVVGIAHNSARGFVSTLCPNLPVRILSVIPEYFTTLQEAYDNAVDEDIIQLHDIFFTGEFHFDFDTSVTIAGGYDCEYTSATGASSVNGDIVISNGTVRIENVILE